MNKKYFALIRHGDYHQKENTPSALQPYPLTKKGFAQARECVVDLTTFCQQEKLTLGKSLHSSPLLRAWQTANEIGNNSGFEGDSFNIECFEGLVERKVGTVANLTIEEVERIIADDPRYETPPSNWKSKSDYCLPFMGAESLIEAGKRVAAHLKKTAASTENNRLQIVVGHGASIRHAALDLGILKLEDIPALSMYHCKPVFFSVDSQGHWQHAGGNWKVRSKYSKENID